MQKLSFPDVRCRCRLRSARENDITFYTSIWIKRHIGWLLSDVVANWDQKLSVMSKFTSYKKQTRQVNTNSVICLLCMLITHQRETNSWPETDGCAYVPLFAFTIMTTRYTGSVQSPTTFFSYLTISILIGNAIRPLGLYGELCIWHWRALVPFVGRVAMGTGRQYRSEQMSFHQTRFLLSTEDVFAFIAFDFYSYAHQWIVHDDRVA